MGKIICRNCYNQTYNGWVKPFQTEVSDPDIIPDYNENVQHYSIYDVSEISSTLQNGQMLEILCVQCKMTHIGKDATGVLKVRYVGNTDWQNYNG